MSIPRIEVESWDLLFHHILRMQGSHGRPARIQGQAWGQRKDEVTLQKRLGSVMGLPLETRPAPASFGPCVDGPRPRGGRVSASLHVTHPP